MKNKIKIGLLFLFFAVIGFNANACVFDFEVLEGD